MIYQKLLFLNLIQFDSITNYINGNGIKTITQQVTNIKTGEHCFTWQPHGSQFTIVEEVPEECLIIRVKQPEKLDKNTVLQALGFDKSWVTVSKKAK